MKIIKKYLIFILILFGEEKIYSFEKIYSLRCFSVFSPILLNQGVSLLDQISPGSLAKDGHEHFDISVFIEKISDVPEEVDAVCGDFVYSMGIEVVDFAHGSPPSSVLAYLKEHVDFLFYYGILKTMMPG